MTLSPLPEPVYDYAPQDLLDPRDRLVDRLLPADCHRTATRWIAFAQIHSCQTLVVPQVAQRLEGDALINWLSPRGRNAALGVHPRDRRQSP